MRKLFWVHPIIIGVLTYLLTFHVLYIFYDSTVKIPPVHHIAWILPFPYTLSCVIGLFFPYNDDYESRKKIRSFKNLYIVTVTKGSNREAVLRSWNTLKNLSDPERGIQMFVLTDEPHFFPDINCVTVPKSFQTKHAKYKARALEYFRLLKKFTDEDWVLHLDEESTIDKESLEQCVNFIEKTDYHFGQGIILYNQHQYWQRLLITVADAIRVGDDVGRFHFQYKIIHRPIFGAHGSFLLNNGAMENEITWEISGMTEDFEFALKSWLRGYRCGEILGLVREQSPQSIIDFLKQRRRWFVGIRSIKHPIPRYLIFQWICGVVCFIVTIANFAIEHFRKMQSPYWVGLIGNFSFVVFGYLYLLGVVVQDYDYGYSFKKILFHVIIAIFLVPIASFLECLSVLYGIFLVPKVFEVIKK
ncbi:unnamed protein product [Brachionus calyciflorus]|uniref:Glycosyltransferase 2-like domain-containing protein n=1 Tax=Brachionus calyciflorus TaxID=104777 RepID=A0A813PLB6_9BILA|nr:unnamed protein product [Brachionus calyciflorus]